MPRSEADAFGVIETAADGQTIAAFLEKPEDPPGIPGSPDQSYVSMGNYVFHRRADRSAEDRRRRRGSVHDMGGNIIPMLTEQGLATVYDFDRNEVPGSTERDHGYWRDVGRWTPITTPMDLVSVHPVFNLYNRKWPILTNPAAAPARQVR